MIAGIGGASFAEQLIAAERMGKDNIYKDKMTTYEAQLDAYKILERSLNKMTSDLEKINGEAFEDKTSSISDENATITVESGAPTGNYDLQIKQLAQAHQVTTSFKSEDAKIPSTGIIEIQVGTDPNDKITLDMAKLNPDGSKTVADLTKMINDHSGNPGVQASLVRTGGQVELMLSSTETGANSKITVKATDTDTDTDWVMIDRVIAQDAEVVLNGMTIKSSSNYLENVIDGVSIELNMAHATGESSSIKIESDTDASEDAIEDFVDSFNDLMKQLDLLTRSMGSEELDQYNDEQSDKEDDKDDEDSDKDSDDEDDEDKSSAIDEDQLGVLKGDSSIRMLQNGMRDAIFDAAPNGMRLSDIGVEMGRDGRLDIDKDKLSKALKDDPDALQAMFTDSGSYIDRLDTLIDPFTKFQGLMYMKQDNLDSQIERVEVNMERHDYQMEARYQVYLAQFTAMEATINQLNAASALFN